MALFKNTPITLEYVCMLTNYASLTVVLTCLVDWHADGSLICLQEHDRDHFWDAFIIVRFREKWLEPRLLSYSPAITNVRHGRNLSPEHYNHCQGDKEKKRKGPFKTVNYLHMCNTVDSQPESCFVVSWPEALLSC